MTMNDKKLEKGMLTLLLIAALTLMAIPCVIASPGEIWSTDSQGNPESEFNILDDVYVTGSGLPANTEVTVYILDPDQGSSVASSSITTDSVGTIPVTLVWSSPLYKITTAEGTIYRLRDYQYEVWIDTNQNGQHDDGDASNVFTVKYPESHHHPGFVIPEPGTMILMLAMFGALATAYLTRKRIH